MSAGIVVLIFACVDFCRTIVGLWQVHVLRHWLVRSIRSLESLGYSANCGKISRRDTNCYAIADSVMINDSIVKTVYSKVR